MRTGSQNRTRHAAKQVRLLFRDRHSVLLITVQFIRSRVHRETDSRQVHECGLHNRQLTARNPKYTFDPTRRTLKHGDSKAGHFLRTSCSQCIVSIVLTSTFQALAILPASDASPCSPLRMEMSGAGPWPRWGHIPAPTNERARQRACFWRSSVQS